MVRLQRKMFDEIELLRIKSCSISSTTSKSLRSSSELLDGIKRRLLQGDSNLINLLRDANWLGISVISHIEFLAFSGLTEADIQLFQRFLQRVEVINLSNENELAIEQIISTRQQYRVNYPRAYRELLASLRYSLNRGLPTRAFPCGGNLGGVARQNRLASTSWSYIPSTSSSPSS